MSAFTDFDAFSPVATGSMCYRLDADLSWDIGRKGSGWSLVVAAGTRFDISVPPPFTWYLSPHDRAVLPCAAIHDELLAQDHDRAFASAEFRRAAIARGVAPFRGWVLFSSTLIWTVMTQKSGDQVREQRARAP